MRPCLPGRNSPTNEVCTSEILLNFRTTSYVDSYGRNNFHFPIEPLKAAYEALESEKETENKKVGKG